MWSPMFAGLSDRRSVARKATAEGSQGAARQRVIRLENLRPSRGGERPGDLCRSSSLVQRGNNTSAAPLSER